MWLQLCCVVLGPDLPGTRLTLPLPTPSWGSHQQRPLQAYWGALAECRTPLAAAVQIRALLKKQQSGKYAGKVASKVARKQHVADNPLPPDELADVFR